VPQQALASILTARVHGAVRMLAQRASQVVFSGRFDLLTGDTVDMLATAVPTHAVTGEQPSTLADVMAALEPTMSKGELRRLVKQRGVSVNGAVVDDINVSLRALDQGGPAVLIAIGKSRRFLARLG
jgi:tyrosyl-tRNA synthetase